MADRTIVVGGGVIGVAAAYYLVRLGSSVTLLEQGALCSGSSQGNAGQITPGHLPLPQPGTLLRNLRWLTNSTSPLYIAPRLDWSLVRWLWNFQRACNRDHLRHATQFLCEVGALSAHLFEELRGVIDCGYAYPGRLEVCRSERSLQAAREEADLLQQFGFTGRLLRGGEVQEMEPAIQAEVAGGIYYPDSGYCHPERLVLAMAEAARGLGAVVRTNTPVHQLRLDGRRVVAAVCGEELITGEHFILASGSWAPQLARGLGLPLPVQPGKGYHVDVDLPGAAPRIPVVFMEERIFVSPLGDVLRMAGTMEFSGFNLTPRPERLDMLVRGAGRYFPEIPSAKVRSRWCHLRPMTPDGLPIIGRVPSVENAWIATGHGMLGITQGPATGRLLAEWVTQGEPSLDLTPARPERFRGKR